MDFTHPIGFRASVEFHLAAILGGQQVLAQAGQRGVGEELFLVEESGCPRRWDVDSLSRITFLIRVFKGVQDSAGRHVVDDVLE
jgi:hypothetical protein